MELIFYLGLFHYKPFHHFPLLIGMHLSGLREPQYIKIVCNLHINEKFVSGVTTGFYLTRFGLFQIGILYKWFTQGHPT